MQEQGWIKLFRNILDKPIWLQSTPEQKTILITLLLMANHKEKEWEWKGEKYKAKPGEFVTSANSIMQKSGVGISRQNVRSALKKFERYEFITYKSTKTGVLINIVNWGIYQHNEDTTNHQVNQEITKGQPITNQEVTTNKNDKNVKNSIYSRVIDYLNEKVGTNYKSTTRTTKENINARLNEGFKEEDFYKVIDIKVPEWKKTEFESYLRPQTLFGTKFESYLNQKKKELPKAVNSGWTKANID